VEQLGYRAADSICLLRDFFTGLTSALSSTIFSTTTRENPRREDKSAGPGIDPACFMNLGIELFRFAIA
jgi:hypothetical protein